MTIAILIVLGVLSLLTWGLTYRVNRAEETEKSLKEFNDSFEVCVECGGMFKKDKMQKLKTVSYFLFARKPHYYSYYCKTHKKPYDENSHGAFYKNKVKVDEKGNLIKNNKK